MFEIIKLYKNTIFENQPFFILQRLIEID